MKADLHVENLKVIFLSCLETHFYRMPSMFLCKITPDFQILIDSISRRAKNRTYWQTRKNNIFCFKISLWLNAQQLAEQGLKWTKCPAVTELLLKDSAVKLLMVCTSLENSSTQYKSTITFRIAFGYSKQTSHLLIRFERSFLWQFNISICRCKRKFFKWQAHADFIVPKLEHFVIL